MTRKLIRNATVVRFEEGDRRRVLVEECRDIHIDGAWIVGVTPVGEPAPGAKAGDAPHEVHDASGKAALPGLVNTHQHLFQSATRAHKPIQNAKLFDWLVAQYRIWAKYSYEDLRLAATISLGEMLLSGATVSADMHYLFPVGSDIAIEAILEAAEAIGIRVVAGRGCMTMGRSQGGLPPDEVCETDAAALRDSERVLDRYHDSSRGSMRQISLMPCAPFNVTEAIMTESLALARAKGAIVQTHLAETEDENDYCQQVYGCRPMQLMEKLGWVGDDVSFAHCVTLNPAEVKLLADTGTGVAHCPSANLRLGSGIAPIADMLDAGVTVGIGVDGPSSNDGMHVLAEARLAVIAQRGWRARPDALTVEDGLWLATMGGAKLLRRPELGNIAAGCAADIALYDLETVERAGGSAQCPLGSLMLGQSSRACDVYVHGQRVVGDGEILGVDMRKVARDLNKTVRAKFLTPREDLKDFMPL
jgi:8-oxoguanine deaminase